MKCTILLFTSYKTVVSREYDGMGIYPGSCGQALLEYLREVDDEISFISALTRFNADFFGHDILLFYSVKKLRKIVFTERAYFRDWFSDFLYLVNVSNRNIKVIDMDGKWIDICPGQVIVMFFGRFYLLTYTNYEPKTKSIPAKQPAYSQYQ